MHLFRDSCPSVLYCSLPTLSSASFIFYSTTTEIHHLLQRKFIVQLLTVLSATLRSFLGQNPWVKNYVG